MGIPPPRQFVHRRPPFRHLSGLRARTPAALTLLVLALSGCTSSSGGQIATAGGGAAAEPTASASPSSTEDLDEQRLAFAQCMRDNGVPMPDPGADSGPRGGFRALDGEVDRETLEAAMSACESLRPAFGGRGGIDLSEEDKQKMLDVAQCLRDAGFPVADPTFDGRGGFMRPDPSSSINPRDEGFRSALAACSAEIGWERPGRRGPDASASPSSAAVT